MCVFNIVIRLGRLWIVYTCCQCLWQIPVSISMFVMDYCVHRWIEIEITDKWICDCVVPSDFFCQAVSFCCCRIVNHCYKCQRPLFGFGFIWMWIYLIQERKYSRLVILRIKVRNWISVNCFFIIQIFLLVFNPSITVLLV